MEGKNMAYAKDTHRQAYGKLVSIVIVILICIFMGIGWLIAVSGEKKNERATITPVSIDSIAEKYHNEDGYYLTVVLEDSAIEYYHLSYDKVSFKTGQRIYDKVFPEDDFIGVSLKMTQPEKRSYVDLGSVLKGKQEELCEIISVTKADNSLIDDA